MAARVWRGTARLGTLFATMERARAELGVLDYVISQTTLEQVFVRFAGEQQQQPEHAVV